ncbi:DYNC1H1 (predicted) [Pycnogonum litorale]
MLHNDRITLAFLLCKIHLKGVPSEVGFEIEFQHLLRGKEGIIPGKVSLSIDGLEQENSESVVALTKLSAFKTLIEKVESNEKFTKWMQLDTPECDVPSLWETKKDLSPISKAMHELLLIQAFRPDRLVAAVHKVVKCTLGDVFMQDAEQEINLSHVVENEVKANTPVLMCSVPGYDASGRVDDLFTEMGKTITSIAIGSAEGFNQAEKAINSASKSGRWVMLKNVHLAPQWLVQLEKKLHSI